MNKPQDIKALVSLLTEKPAMYIGRVDLFCLMAFLNGYVTAKADNEDLLLLNEFQKYIQKKYNIESSQSWASIISFFYPDNYKALETFFENFNQFISEQNTNHT